jgi:hypothetical protein
MISCHSALGVPSFIRWLAHFSGRLENEIPNGATCHLGASLTCCFRRGSSRVSLKVLGSRSKLRRKSTRRLANKWPGRATEDVVGTVGSHDVTHGCLMTLGIDSLKFVGVTNAEAHHPVVAEEQTVASTSQCEKPMVSHKQ